MSGAGGRTEEGLRRDVALKEHREGRRGGELMREMRKGEKSTDEERGGQGRVSRIKVRFG